MRFDLDADPCARLDRKIGIEDYPRDVQRAASGLIFFRELVVAKAAFRHDRDVAVEHLAQEGNERFGVMREELESGGCDPLALFRVPGCFEIPQMAQRLASSGRYDALVSLGTLIRGETSHFDALCSTVFQGLAEVGRSTGVPVGLGVLTAESLDQALERAGGKLGNRGADAALSVIEMANLFRTLES